MGVLKVDFGCVYMLPLSRALTFLYPYGATLNVIKPAMAVLSTGSECFPFNRPVLAFHQGKVSDSFSYSVLIKSILVKKRHIKSKMLYRVGNGQTGCAGFLPHLQ